MASQLFAVVKFLPVAQKVLYTHSPYKITLVPRTDNAEQEHMEGRKTEWSFMGEPFKWGRHTYMRAKITGQDKALLAERLTGDGQWFNVP